MILAGIDIGTNSIRLLIAETGANLSAKLSQEAAKKDE